MYSIQHCFLFRPSDSTVSENAGIEPRTVVALAFAVDALTTRLDLSLVLHPGFTKIAIKCIEGKGIMFPLP
jgi:hypothetical protein